MDAPSVSRDDERSRLAALRRYDILDTPGERAFDNITDLVCTLLNVSTAGVTLMDEDRVCFKSLFGAGVREMPRSQSFCRFVVEGNQPVIISDTHRDPRTSDHPMVVGDPYIGSYIGVPLIDTGGHCLGTLLALDYVPREFNMRHVAILEKLAEIVIDQIELRHCAERDHLSGALTRGAMLGEMEREITRFLRYRRPSALLLIDIDNFKEINDRFGHARGDDVLREVAACCERLKRSGDSFGRLGGDEFVLLLPETEIDEATIVADRILEGFRSISIPDLLELKVTGSLGLAVLEPACASSSLWLEAADRGLYDAKHGGRDRCCVGRLQLKGSGGPEAI